MKNFTLLGCLLAMLAFLHSAQAQTKPVETQVVAVKSGGGTEAPALITDKMADPTPNTDALKVRVDTNPLTKRLIVRTNATGPTRVEVNGTDGRPVITRDLISGDAAAVLDVSTLPAGSYIVQCSSGERRGIKKVLLGQ